MQSPKDLPDILIVGLQQIMSNKSSSMFSKNKDRITFMQNNIMNQLNTHAPDAGYTLVRQLDQHGLFILLIAKAEVQTRIFDVAMCYVKPPTGNRSGNKGAVTMRFGFEDSSFVFLNCHLAGGTLPRNVQER